MFFFVFYRSSWPHKYAMLFSKSSMVYQWLGLKFRIMDWGAFFGSFLTTLTASVCCFVSKVGLSKLRPCICRKISVFRKSRKSTENFSYFPGIKFRKNVPEMFEIVHISGTFRYIPSIKWPKLVQNDSKNGRKSQKLYRNFWHFDHRLGLLTFWHVPKMYRSSKLLPECMALV